MSNQTPSNNPAPQPFTSKSSQFLDRMVLFLMPYFISITPDFNAARSEIIETLESYGARTRAEVLHAVQIIAFSFATLDGIAEAKAATDMSPSMRLRFYGCANNLSRSSQHNEKSLARRLACDIPKPATECANDMPDAAFVDALKQAQAQIATYQQRRSDDRSAILAPHILPPADQAANSRIWSGAMMDALAEMGMPVQPSSSG